MTNRNDILNELNGLESSLAKVSAENIYSAPAGYFEGLADQVLNRIKALEASTAKEELEILSPILATSKGNPFTVPVGYFENLSERVMANINAEIGYQTSAEEIESISPLLSSISKKIPYSVPAGYFENLAPAIEKKVEARVISITSRRWFRLAAAACIIGVIAIGALLFINQKPIDPNSNPQAWVKKNVTKKVSQEKLDEFVTLANDEDNLNEINDNEVEKTAEIKELMKDVSEKELQDFLNDAVALESNDDTDAMMN